MKVHRDHAAEQLRAMGYIVDDHEYTLYIDRICIHCGCRSSVEQLDVDEDGTVDRDELYGILLTARSR